MPNPAEMLQGLTLDSGWYVDQFLIRSSAQTGGTFSTSYRLTKADGSSAFMARKPDTLVLPLFLK